jgi:hypothetical protein
MAASTSPPGARTVFYSINAQWDNLGDIEIRNTALEWIRATGAPTIAFTGAMPADYIECFEIDSTVSWEPNPARYQRALWKHILLRRASIVFAPGPQVFSSGWRSMLKSGINWINVVGVRASGGRVLAAGRSLRGSGRLAKALETSIVSRFNTYVVRDTRSAEVLGRSLANAPDLAFSHAGPVAGHSKDLAVISLRGDREIDVAALREVVVELRERGLTPVIATQVKRDDDQHRSLAELLGVESVLWNEHSHAEQLERVRSTYSRSKLVVSNRLHALIFAMQFGALPVAVIDEGSDKLPSTLQPWVKPLFTNSKFESVAGKAWRDVDLLAAAAALDSDLSAARVALGTLRTEFIATLRSADGHSERGSR